MRLHLAAFTVFCACALSAQMPDPAFFTGDPQKIMLFCADQARSLKPGKDQVLAQAGRAHLLAGDAKGAEAMFQLAARGDAQTQRWIGQAWLEAGDPQRAMRAFSRILDLHPYAKNEATEAAVLMMDGGHPGEAAALMAQAYRIAPGDWQNADAFARACLRQQRPDLASEWFAHAAARNRDEDEFWMDVAHSLLNQGAEE